MNVKYSRSKAILGWHFVSLTNGVPMLKSHDKTSNLESLVVAPGYVYTTDEPRIVACESGLHSSRRALDALQYAPGAIICRVRSWGEVDEREDKIAARHREVAWVADAESELRLFACWCARQVWRLVTDERLRRAVEVAEAYARKKATNKQLAAANYAAWAVARADVGAAAWATARATARAAAWDAAGAAARAAAGAAAGAIPRNSVWAAAWDVESAELERRMLALEPK